MKKIELYNRAGDLAKIAMGRIKVRSTVDMRRKESVWAAEEDPLAWWCLVECIVQLADNSAKPSNEA